MKLFKRSVVFNYSAADSAANSERHTPLRPNCMQRFFEFRTEIFNVFNRVQFGPPLNYFGVPTFGVVSSQVNNPSLFQFSGRVSF